MKQFYDVSCLMNHQTYEKVEDYVEFAEKRLCIKICDVTICNR
jgi:hypothetical protein